MRSRGPVRKYASTSEGSYTLPANTKRITLQNLSMVPIRFATVTGKVATPTSASNIVYEEFWVLPPGGRQEHTVAISSGTLYYAAEVAAEFLIDPWVA